MKFRNLLSELVVCVNFERNMTMGKGKKKCQKKKKN